jgi:hypothetical protein
MAGMRRRLLAARVCIARELRWTAARARRDRAMVLAARMVDGVVVVVSEDG